MRRVGPYELVSKLGAGGMAEVWMGRRVSLGGASKSLAIKLLAAHHLEKPEYRDMFVAEARLSMLLTHSNIVQVFDTGEDMGNAYMAMEWVDGCDLADLTKRLHAHGQRLSDEVIAFIVGEVLRALRYAHELTHEGSDATIVHRDISPQNVMLSVSGEVKLTDFGVARIAGDDTSGQYVKGKLRYMPPEQLRGRSRAPTIDLFAVGAILHELLDGQKFRGSALDEGELYGMILEGTYPPLSLDPGEVPIEIDQLRWGLLASRVEDRLPSARHALAKLRRWPGYRDASMELEELVRWAVGTEAPRTGLPAPPPAQLGGTVVLHAAAVVGPDGASWTPEMTTDRESVYEDSQTSRNPTRRMQPDTGRNPAVPDTDAERPISQVHPVPDPTQRRRRRPIWLPLAMVLIAFGFGLFSAGMFLGWFEPGPDPDARASATDPTAPADAAEDPDPPAEVVGEVEDPGPSPHDPDPEPEPDPDPIPEDDPVLEDEPILEDEPEPIAEDATRPEAPPAKKRRPAKVSVTLVTKHYDGLQVKIGSTEVEMAKKKTIELRPASYQISLRESDEGAWKPAGKITVEPEAQYRVTLLKPPLAKVEKVEQVETNE